MSLTFGVKENLETREVTKVPIITSYTKGQRLLLFEHSKLREGLYEFNFGQ